MRVDNSVVGMVGWGWVTVGWVMGLVGGVDSLVPVSMDLVG